MSRLLWSVMGLVVLTTFPGAAFADITRGCKANFQIVVTQYKGQYNHGKGVGKLDDFDASGSCKNKAQANKCRERAKNSIFGCAKDYWNQRGAKALPTRCKLGRGGVGVRGLGPFKRGYDLKFAIEYVACCQLQPKADELTVDVRAVSHGDKGCGRNRNQGSVGSGKFMETYSMGRGYRANCKKLRAMGWCS